MSNSSRSSGPTETVLDPALAPRRLKQGLIPPDTGIYIRIEESPWNGGAGTVYTLSSGGVYLIGREGSDIPLRDDRVSRKHAEIGLYGPGGFVVRDLASTNGTRLNGKRIHEKAKLADGDLIQVGETAIRFSVVENAIQLS
jgi:pSer/pThr/pTyr-binding forkhead associated (FHA) protein